MLVVLEAECIPMQEEVESISVDLECGGDGGDDDDDDGVVVVVVVLVLVLEKDAGVVEEEGEEVSGNCWLEEGFLCARLECLNRI